MAINLDTAYLMTRAVARADAARPAAASIVYIGTSAMLDAVPGRRRLHRVKSALGGLMRAVDVEVRKEGIRANAVVVKIVDTPRNRADNPDADHSRWTTGDELAERRRVALHRRLRAALGRDDPGVWPRLSRARASCSRT